LPRPRPLVVEERGGRPASRRRWDLSRLPQCVWGSPGSAASPPGWSFSRISPSRAPRAALVGQPTLAPPPAAMRSAKAREKRGRRKGSDKVWVESTVLGPPMCYVQECAPPPGGSQPPVGLRLNIALFPLKWSSCFLFSKV
jgi:hypothetical protein